MRLKHTLVGEERSNSSNSHADINDFLEREKRRKRGEVREGGREEKGREGGREKRRKGEERKEAGRKKESQLQLQDSNNSFVT